MLTKLKCYEICVRLDGLPLAIELAAARIKILSPHALLARIENRLSFLVRSTRDLLNRYQSLRATIDWSYNLLGLTERVLFARLAVFVRGCTLEAAEKVCSDDFGPDILDQLTALVNNSLLQQQECTDGELRFTMLETIREYAAERLTENEDINSLREHHASFFLQLAEIAEVEIGSPYKKGKTVR